MVIAAVTGFYIARIADVPSLIYWLSPRRLFIRIFDGRTTGPVWASGLPFQDQKRSPSGFLDKYICPAKPYQQDQQGL